MSLCLGAEQVLLYPRFVKRALRNHKHLEVLLQGFCEEHESLGKSIGKRDPVFGDVVSG